MSILIPRHLRNSDMDEVRQLRTQVASRKDDHRRSADDACYRLDESLHRLEEFTRELLDHGIAVISASLHEHAVLRLNIDLVKYTKKIQQQAQRPVVVMQQKSSGYCCRLRIWEHWVLTLPTSMNNLMAPLLLQSVPMASVDSDGYYSSNELPASIYHEPSSRSWSFMFLTDHNSLGSKAEDIRSGWLNLCKEDNLLRLCLNVPTVPVDMSDYR